MMYQKHYGLLENPFRLTTDTKFVYWSQTHQSAYRHLLYSVQSAKSLIVLAGAVGAGKTTLLHVLMEWVKTSEPTTRLAYVVHSTLTVTELLCYIAHELGLQLSGQNKIEYVLALQRFSRQCAEQDCRLLLILDEAQNYSHDVLEEIRLLSNIETPHDKPLQIILAGQPQLITNINQQDIYQLKQRVSVTYNLLPLNYEETYAYIQKRLDVAGAQGRQLFSEDAVDVIYQYAQGLPRVINVLCDHALLYAFSANKKQVSDSIVREVAVDMGLRRGQALQHVRPEAPDAAAEGVAEVNPQADRIIIGYTKNTSKPGNAPTASPHEIFTRPADWDDDWGDHANQKRRRSLLQFAGIAFFIILLLIGMFFVDLPHINIFPFQKESSAGNSSAVIRDREAIEPRQVYSSAILDKEIVTQKELTYAHQNHNGTEKERVDPARAPAPVKENTTKALEKEEGKYVTVRDGDTFEKVLLKEYGQYDSTLISLVLEANPDISNINVLYIGQRIRLPKP